MLLRKRVCGVIGFGCSIASQSASDGPKENTDCSKAIKPISISHHTSLQGKGFDTSTETMSNDSVYYGLLDSERHLIKSEQLPGKCDREISMMPCCIMAGYVGYGSWRS